MSSGGHRGFTIVTILMLIFAPVLRNHHWVYQLTGTKTETHVEQCAAKAPCPALRFEVVMVKPPLPPDPSR